MDNKLFEMVIKLSVDRASQVLSKTVKCGCKIQLESIDLVDVSLATEQVMAEESSEVIASMIEMQGDIGCDFLFMIKSTDAVIFTDLVLGREIGTTKEVDLYTNSTIQEIGNILSSCVGNVFSKDFGKDVLPSPPHMMNDYKGTVFSTFAMNSALKSDEIYLVRTKFFAVKTQVECEMFLVPDLRNIKNGVDE